MNKSNLVILKENTPLIFKTDTFYPHKHYRCIIIGNQYLVYGVIFDEKTYNELFETSYDRIIRDFKSIGILCVDGEIISKSVFTNLADIHEYGRGKNKLNVWYFRNSKSCIYGFYPSQGNKKENQDECYQWYLDIINGNLQCIDDNDVCFGNCGVPLTYTELRITYDSNVVRDFYKIQEETKYKTIL